MAETHLKGGQFRCQNCGRPRYAIERCCDEYDGEERTFWNGEPTPARKVLVTVGPSSVKTWWCAELEGTERQAVEVNLLRRQVLPRQNDARQVWCSRDLCARGPLRGTDDEAVEAWNTRIEVRVLP